MRRSAVIIGSVLLVIATACGGDSAPPDTTSREAGSAVSTTPEATDPDESLTTEPATDAPTTVAESSTTSVAGQPSTTTRRATYSTSSTSTSTSTSTSSSTTSSTTTTTTLPPGVADVLPTTITANPYAGQPSSHQFLITNIGQGVLELRSITVVSGSGLSISMGSCGATLPSGNLCFPTIDVVALPSGSTLTGQVRIVTNSPTSPDFVTINITVP